MKKTNMKHCLQIVILFCISCYVVEGQQNNGNVSPAVITGRRGTLGILTAGNNRGGVNRLMVFVPNSGQTRAVVPSTGTNNNQPTNGFSSFSSARMPRPLSGGFNAGSSSTSSSQSQSSSSNGIRNLITNLFSQAITSRTNSQNRNTQESSGSSISSSAVVNTLQNALVQGLAAVSASRQAEPPTSTGTSFQPGTRSSFQTQGINANVPQQSPGSRGTSSGQPAGSQPHINTRPNAVNTNSAPHNPMQSGYPPQSNYDSSNQSPPFYSPTNQGQPNYNPRNPAELHRANAYPEQPHYQATSYNQTSYVPAHSGHSNYRPTNPGQSDYRPTNPGQTDYRPTNPAQPDYHPTIPGQPDYRRSNPSQSDYQSTYPSQPDYRQTNPGQSDYLSYNPGQSDYQSSNPGQQDYHPTNPGQPGYRLTNPGQPDYRPTNPDQTDYRPTNPGQTDYRPTNPGQTDYRPTNPGQTDYRPTNPGQADYRPTNPGQLEYRPTNPGQPEYRPINTGPSDYSSTNPGQPEYHPTNPGQPEYRPINPGQSDYPSTNPGQPEYRPTNPVQTDYRPIIPGQPDYQPANPGQPDYRPSNPGQTDYRPTNPGHQAASYNQTGYVPAHSSHSDYRPTNPGQPDYRPTNPGQSDYRPANPGQPDYLPTNPGQSDYRPINPGQPDYRPVGEYDPLPSAPEGILHNMVKHIQGNRVPPTSPDHILRQGNKMYEPVYEGSVNGDRFVLARSVGDGRPPGRIDDTGTTSTARRPQLNQYDSFTGSQSFSDQSVEYPPPSGYDQTNVGQGQGNYPPTTGSRQLPPDAYAPNTYPPPGSDAPRGDRRLDVIRVNGGRESLTIESSAYDSRPSTGYMNPGSIPSGNPYDNNLAVFNKQSAGRDQQQPYDSPTNQQVYPGRGGSQQSAGGKPTDHTHGSSHGHGHTPVDGPYSPPAHSRTEKTASASSSSFKGDGFIAADSGPQLPSQGSSAGAISSPSGPQPYQRPTEYVPSGGGLGFLDAVVGYDGQKMLTSSSGSSGYVPQDGNYTAGSASYLPGEGIVPPDAILVSNEAMISMETSLGGMELPGGPHTTGFGIPKGLVGGRQHVKDLSSTRRDYSGVIERGSSNPGSQSGWTSSTGIDSSRFFPDLSAVETLTCPTGQGDYGICKQDSDCVIGRCYLQGSTKGICCE